MRIPLILLAAASFNAFADDAITNAEIASVNVAARGDLSCKAFLFTKKKPNPALPLILSFEGTGLYTQSQGEFATASIRLFEAKKTNALVIDKPGIEYDSSFKASSSFDQF